MDFYNHQYFFIETVADDNGDIIRCRWAQNTSECGGICDSFPGAVLNQVSV